MFEDLKRAWREAIENFRRELHADGGTGADLERELQAAESELRRMEAELEKSRRQLEVEREGERVCGRREKLARSIGDAETARIAAEFAARHQERAAVLTRKVDALQAEHALHTRELLELEEHVSRRRLDPDGRVTGRGAGNGSPEDDDAFRRIEREARELEAEARLQELKRRMR